MARLKVGDKVKLFYRPRGSCDYDAKEDAIVEEVCGRRYKLADKEWQFEQGEGEWAYIFYAVPKESGCPYFVRT